MAKAVRIAVYHTLKTAFWHMGGRQPLRPENKDSGKIADFKYCKINHMPI
ncbi:hypothetical protein HMPREF3156_01912 [Neisseria sp. HMSC06F02]|uniref:Uncharacterized protein n=1 Tax=Neisseria sicca VK64 TaxID=1095748 RepID=I2NWQ7_NEISI|nr:hypothetical protein HMPREF1051_0247 [Neisseria sicca VK64]KJJ14801.1 hypothetical protein HMPREF3156_01912 [Neisseria sp. HMSC06F02]